MGKTLSQILEIMDWKYIGHQLGENLPGNWSRWWQSLEVGCKITTRINLRQFQGSNDQKMSVFYWRLTNKTWNVFQLENEYSNDKDTNSPFKTVDKNRQSGN